MDQYNDTLLEAVQEPNVSGALQQLLMAKGAASPQASNPAALQQVMMQRMLGRQNTPEQSAQLQENRASALKQYQEALMQPSSGPMTASEVGAYNWIGNMGKMSPFAALTSGVAAGGQALMDSFAGERNGNVAAARVGYDDAAQLDVLDSRELPYLKAGATAKVSVGGTGGAEKILPLYGKIFNSYSQQAKDMQFATPAERTAWIRQNTDETVKATVGQFGISVNPEVLGKLFSATASVDSENADATSTSRIVQSNGSPAAKQTASSEISSASPPGMQIAPGTQKARDSEASRLRNGEMDGSLPGWPTMPAEPSAASSVDRGKFAQSTPPGTPPFRNVPNEKLMAKGAEGMGEAYTKDYTAMQDSAAAARDQLEAYNALEKIDPNTGAFADVQGYIGTALQGMGIDPNTPLIQDAIKNRQANTIISQMSNAALRGEKGVQTRSDEVRIQNELAKTTDPKQAWNYLVQLGKERAQRRVDMLEFAGQVAAENNGVPIAAREKFISSIADDPLTQEFGGKLVFRSQVLDAFKRKYPDATDAEAREYWRSLEQNWKSRQKGK